MERQLRRTQKMVPAPGFVAARPMFPAIVQLFDDLGRTNQYILVNELAARELRDQAQDPGNGGIESYIVGVSKKQKIRVSLSDFMLVSASRYAWYVSILFTTLDRSLRQLIREIKLYKCSDRWIDQRGDDQLSALEQLARNQPPDQKRLDTYPEFKILEHYRLVRNEHEHAPRSHRSPATVSREKFLEKWPTYVQETYKYTSAPNLPSALTMDDFFLFSRVSRDFSSVISDAYDLTVADIAAVVGKDSRVRASVKSSIQAADRVSGIFRGYYVNHHLRRGDEVSFAHAEDFVDEMLRRFEEFYSKSAPTIRGN